MRYQGLQNLSVVALITLALKKNVSMRERLVLNPDYFLTFTLCHFYYSSNLIIDLLAIYSRFIEPQAEKQILYKVTETCLPKGLKSVPCSSAFEGWLMEAKLTCEVDSIQGAFLHN